MASDRSPQMAAAPPTPIKFDLSQIKSHPLAVLNRSMEEPEDHIEEEQKQEQKPQLLVQSPPKEHQPKQQQQHQPVKSPLQEHRQKRLSMRSIKPAYYNNNNDELASPQPKVLLPNFSIRPYTESRRHTGIPVMTESEDVAFQLMR